MKAKRERLLHLHHSLADNWRAMERLLRWDPDLKQLYNLSPHDFSSLLAISSKRAAQLYSTLHSIMISSILDELQRHDICYTTIFDDTYPSLLKEIVDPPFVLYGKGDLFLMQHEKKLAVVGTRRPSHYGILSVQSILSELLKEDWVIVSGMAYGIDMAAHISAAHQNRYTIAVLGGGFRYIYPKDNYTVLQKHSQYVLYVTEYPPHFRPQKWYFPRRNRIISGLSKGVVVVEAKERSGSLITVDCALEQNREVFAIPGPIHMETSAGTNWLIQQGAKLVLHAADITEEF